MNNTVDSAYCRLCAELKPHHKLENLQTDEEMCQQVVKKLARFNIVMNFQENVLPKAVCLSCVKCLERAFDFVTAVEQAQAFLNDFILVHIKTTERDSSNENMFYEPPDERVVNLKNEESREFMEINVYDPNLIEKCESDVMNDVCDDYFMNKESISSSHVFDIHFDNTKELEIENKNHLKPLTIIVENTDTNDDGEKPNLSEIICDFNHSEDNRIMKNVHNNYINMQNNSYVSIENMGGSAPKVQPKQEKCKILTTVHSETNINKIKKPPKKYQENKKLKTENTDIDIEHIKQTWQDYEWKCSHCETIFPNLEELRNHSMQYHNSCNPYQCTDCPCKRSVLNIFLNHVKKHRNYLAHSCYKCFKKFPTRNLATSHKRKVHDNSKYACPGCNIPFSSNIELQEHVNKYFNKWLTIAPSNLTCNICNKKSETSAEFQRHILTHKGKKEVLFCETCGKNYKSKGSLNAHIKIAHSSQKNMFNCDICNLSFCTAIKLQYHKSVHTGIKPFICDHCGKTFRMKQSVAEHMKFHRTSRPYSCTVCDRKFNLAHGLKRHMLQHTGERPFSCHICQRDFTNLSNCNKHIRRIHGIEMSKKRESNIVKLETAPGSASDLQLKLNA